MKVGLFSAFLFFAAASMAQAHEVNVGETPPDFVGLDEDSHPLHLADMRGKVVIVTFWATWCPYCREELPVLEAIQRQAGKAQLRIIAVNYQEDRRTFSQARFAMKDFSITIASDFSRRASRSYGVDSLPHMFMIGRDGTVKHIHLGYGEEDLDGIVNELNALLLEKPSAAASAD